jgi:diguanylate cyclase (GGDEF)-like protein
MDFVRISKLLRDGGGKEPYAELATFVRQRFPGRGHVFDIFLEQLRPLASGFLTVPALSDNTRSRTVRYWLGEAAQARGETFKPVLLRWFWVHHERWMRDFLGRWSTRLNWIIEDLAVSATEVLPPESAAHVDILVAHAPGCDLTFLQEVAESLLKRSILLGFIEICDDIEAIAQLFRSAVPARLSVIYSSNFDPISDDKFIRSRAFIIQKSQNIITLKEFGNIAAVRHGDGRKIPYLETVAGLSQTVSALERAVNALQVNAGFFSRFYTSLSQKNEGQEFLQLRMRAVAQESSGRISVALFDIDKMNQINRRFGDDCGDAVIARTLNIISARALEISASCGRCGDDTFYAVTADGLKRDGFFKDLNHEIADWNWSEEAHDLQVTCSAGYARGRQGEAVEDVVVKAAIGMNEAKKLGGNQMQIGPKRISNAMPRHIRKHFS